MEGWLAKQSIGGKCPPFRRADGRNGEKSALT
jgi:hypothetical protein